MDEQRSSTPYDRRLQTRPSLADTGSVLNTEAVAFRMAALARDLQQQHGSHAVMDRAVAAAVALVPGAEHGALSVVGARRTLTPAATTGDLAQGMEALQNDVRQGPGLEAAFDHRTCRVDDLSAETTRWPALAACAGQVGVASVLCLPLFVSEDRLGVLSLFSTALRAFDEASEHMGLVLAAHVAVAVASAQEVENTARGLEHRDVIGQAKGVLMERHRLSAQEAFDVLARFSQETSRKLHTIAVEVAASTTTCTPR
ncbi:GAF and ANTAR domain-containing protein [Quadrisphaera sp. INWT6]|uniref:GAF and ANTAR domain-containing protein n=1 Tax=Quadrisphaera sp. INWT6 TaxID=2596917 RepID=UPI0018927231|nr:GAF and ANTAR domain-containing protein [Quadrisphaera sp. INWT6]MBF5081175.1 GAF and ANTAR domain-containing protein [Quadrisphaera sp. INWT6]